MLVKKLLVASAVTILLSAQMALAVDLVNKDGKKYDIKVKSSSSTASTSIESNTTKQNICKECTIVVDGVGDIEASGDDKVVIKDGKLAKD